MTLCRKLLMSAALASVWVPGLVASDTLLAQDGETSGPAAKTDEQALPLDPRFSADRIKADVSFLADDLLEGRGLGTRGYEIAARFVGQQFAGMGLKPMGDDGSWYQRITFQKTVRTDAPSGIDLTGPSGTRRFVHGKDVLIGLNANEPQLDVAAPLVFVGYGIDNQRLGINDYAGLDVKGKVVVVLRGYPLGLPSEAGAYLSSSKSAAAQAHGAIGVITLETNSSMKVRPFARRLQYADTPSFTWLDKTGKAFDETPQIRAGASVDEAAAIAIMAGAPRSLVQIRKEAERKGGRPKGFNLASTIRIFGQSKTEAVTSPNIVAMLPGSDPVLSKEVIVLSGHLDHLGVRAAKPGDADATDRIFNGAMDNAAGSATTLEVARVMAQDKVAPKRSVLFLITTGEEMGLLGAEYFAHNPTVSAKAIVGNVDLDMPLLLYPFNDVTAYGADHSTIGAQVAQAVAPMNVGVAPDPLPEENIFVRSDHYMFVKQGVPAVFLATGYGNGGEAAWTKFLSINYHQPSDDVNQPIDWRAGARFAEANYRITRAMADSTTPPRWYRDDFFGDLFAPDATKAPVGAP